MTFDDILDQAIALLQRRVHVTSRTLKRQFDLGDDVLEDLKGELINGQRLALDEGGRVLVWARLGRVEAMGPVNARLSQGRGVPLFVEELTTMVLESGPLREGEERYELTAALPPLAIPATLHDSLIARLDRLTVVKAVVQLRATLGREFSYEQLQAVSNWHEETLRWGLQQLVAAELLYQQGVPPQALYVFKHTSIQEAAYQSLPKSTRQQYH
jgi:predicted ATPase